MFVAPDFLLSLILVEYHAVRFAEMQAYLAYTPGWSPYRPLIVSGVLENVAVLQKNRSGWCPWSWTTSLARCEFDTSLKELKTEELQQIQSDVLVAAS